MAENKADALNQADEYKTNLEVFYSGDTPAECGKTVVFVRGLDESHHPWLIKWRTDTHLCHQFADTRQLYMPLSKGLNTILDSVIVNNKQREAVGILIDNLLRDQLLMDMAHQNDFISEDIVC